MSGFRTDGGARCQQSLWPRASSLIEKETSLEPEINLVMVKLCDFDCGSGFQPRSYDDSNKATFFRGWKPLPREPDVKLMTLPPISCSFTREEKEMLDTET
jgi:hypothetical protein